MALLQVLPLPAVLELHAISRTFSSLVVRDLFISTYVSSTYPSTIHNIGGYSHSGKLRIVQLTDFHPVPAFHKCADLRHWNQQ